MNDEIGNLVLEHLKALRSELRDLRTEMHTDMDDLKARMSSLEAAMLTVKREVVHGEETDARQQIAIDHIVQRLNRIERRLELS